MPFRKIPDKMSPARRPVQRLAVAIACLFGIVAAVRAQSSCGPEGTQKSPYPQYSGTITGVLTTGGGSNYVYGMTQYGIARASLANPASPGPTQLAQIGLDYSVPPPGNGGYVPLACDCHQGGTTIAIAENPADGSSRGISDWVASTQGGGLPGQAVRGLGAGDYSFAQQVNVVRPPLGSLLAAIYLPSGKYIGYFPDGAEIQVVDLTPAINKNPDPLAALRPFSTLAWPATKLKAAQVGGSYLLVAATGNSIRIANINASTGALTDTLASVSTTASPVALSLASVNGRTFVFSAEGTSGLQVYEYKTTPVVSLVLTGSISGGNYNRVVVRGAPGAPFPLIFAHHSGANDTIDIYDTNWLTQTPVGTPRLAASLVHGGGPVPFFSPDVDAVVQQVGSVVTAYVYRVAYVSGAVFHATTVDVSCVFVDPTAPAQASLIAANLTHPGGPNYYGDRWRMRDTTATGVPLIQMAWDVNVTGGTFKADPSPWRFTGTPIPSTVSTLDGGGGSGPGIIWPCDPWLGGNPNDSSSGSGCPVSIGAGNPPGPGAFAIGIQTTNSNPPGSPAPSTYVAPLISVQVPQAYVNGQTGTSIALNVLSGDSLDASASQGNLAEATYSWTFTGCSCSVPGAKIVAIPTGATGFQLQTSFPGGYQSPVTSGSLTQQDLVASFTVTSSVLKATPLTLTNTMRTISATVTGVAYVIKQGVVPVPGFSGPLASTFFPKNGTATVTAPATVGGYTIELTYTFNGPSSPNPQVQFGGSQPFSTVDWSPAPRIGVFDGGGSQLGLGGFGIQLVANTTYYMKDTEVVPNGMTYPGAAFSYCDASNNCQQWGTTTAVNQTVGFTPLAACTNCSVKVVINGTGATNSAPVSVGSGVLPLSVSLSGPFTGATQVPVTIFASASGGSGGYQYAWKPGEAPSFELWSPGGSSFAYTYNGAGTYTVQCRVTSGGLSSIGSWAVTITGAPGTPLSVTLGGPSTALKGTPVTVTATVAGGSGNYSYSWKPGEAPAFETWSPGGSSFTNTYGAAGTYTISCQISDGVSTLVRTKTIAVTLVPPPSSAFTLAGATFNTDSGAYDAEEGQTVTFNAQEIPGNVASNGYTWDFGDGSPRYGQQVAFAFSGTGSRSVTLTVVGDGVNTLGTVSAVISFDIHLPSFQALLVPAAEHFFPVPGDTSKISATDVAISNPGTTPLTISPAFLGFTATIPNWVFDLSTVAFDPAREVTIPPYAVWSQVDVVKYLAGDVPNKGTLVFKYEGGDATPVVTSRVYFAPVTDPLGPSAGSAFPPLKATKEGQVLPQGTQLPAEQSLPGLRGDASYDFRMSLFNSVGVIGSFRISAVDQDGNTVTTLKDPIHGGTGSYVDFVIGPYQAVDWSSDDLGLNDPTKRYVLQARKTPGFTTGRLLPLVTMRDRITRDQVVVTPDTPPEYREPCDEGRQFCVNYVIPGASRYPTPDGARWKTSISIYNPSSQNRGLLLTYTYTTTDLLAPEKVASSFIVIGPGKLAAVPGLQGVVCCDDVVSQLFATQDNHLADLLNGTFGILQIQHYVDLETSTSPLMISARNYDDQPTGTYGSQLAVYTRPISLGAGETPLLLAGLEQDDSSNPKPRFAPTTVNVFAYDDVLTVVRLTAIKNDGTELGHHIVALNNPGASGHFQPRSLGAKDFTGDLNGIQNEPISVKIEVLQGGRVGAYALIQDITTRDPTYVQAAPQN